MIKGQCSLRRPIRVHRTFAHMFFMSYCVSITKTFQQFSDRYTDFTDISVTNYPTLLELNNQSKVVLLGPGDVNVEGNMKVPFGVCITYWVNWCFFLRGSGTEVIVVVPNGYEGERVHFSELMYMMYVPQSLMMQRHLTKMTQPWRFGIKHL